MQNKQAYFWGLIGRFVPQFVSLATNMVLARLLSPDDFGMIAVLSVIIMVAETLIDSGLGGSLVKEDSITEDDCATIFSFNLFLSVLLYIICFASAGVVEQFYKIEGLSSVFRWIAIVFVLNAFGVVPKALLNRDLRFKEISFVAIGAIIIAAVVSILMALRGLGVYALIAYQLVQTAVSVIFFLMLSKMRMTSRFKMSSFKRLFSFGMFTTLINVIDTIYENLATVLFGKYFSVEQAGYVSQSKRIEEVASRSVVTTINTVSFPILTRYKDNKEVFVREAASIYKNICLLLIPCLLAVAAFSDEAIVLCFGKQWEPAGPYLKLLLFAGVFIIMENLNRNFIKSYGEVGKLFILTILKRSIGLLIILGFMWIDKTLILHGYIVSAFFAYLMNMFLYGKLLDLSFGKQFIEMIRVLVPAVVFYIVLIALRYCVHIVWIEILLGAIVVSVYYFIVLKALNINVINKVVNFLKK